MALKEVPGMPITKELTMRMDNRSGSLGKVCRSLADQSINILAFQSIPSERTILVCIVVDKPAAAEAVLEKERITYTEGEVVQVKLPHTPGRCVEPQLDISFAQATGTLLRNHKSNQGAASFLLPLCDMPAHPNCLRACQFI